MRFNLLDKTETSISNPETPLEPMTEASNRTWFLYKVSSKGIFYNGEKQDITMLNGIINERLVDALTNAFGLEKGEELFNSGDRYLMAAIINNTTEEAAKTNLENYYNTILNNRNNDGVGIIYDLKDTSLFSRLRNKSNIFNDEYNLSYFKDMAYMGKDFSKIRANTGIKLEFAMRNILGKAKNIFQRTAQRKLEAGKDMETSKEKITTPEQKIEPELSTLEERDLEVKKEKEYPDLANNNEKDTYQRLQVLLSHLGSYAFIYPERWQDMVKNALNKGEISESEADNLNAKISELHFAYSDIDFNFLKNTTLRNSTIKKAYVYVRDEQGQEKSFRESIKPNPLFTQITTMVGEATSPEELRAWGEITEVYRGINRGLISNENAHQIYSQIEERKKSLELSQREERTTSQSPSHDTDDRDDFVL